MSRLRVQSLVRAHIRTNNSMFLSLINKYKKILKYFSRFDPLIVHKIFLTLELSNLNYSNQMWIPTSRISHHAICTHRTRTNLFLALMPMLFFSLIRILCGLISLTFFSDLTLRHHLLHWESSVFNFKDSFDSNCKTRMLVIYMYSDLGVLFEFIYV